nr:hypothetical protein [Tanacetum cinerariifolium]
MKILDILEQRIKKVGKHLNKAKEKMDINKGKEKIVMEREVIIIESDTCYEHKPFQVTYAESSDHNLFQATANESSDHNSFQVTSYESSNHNPFQVTSDESSDHNPFPISIHNFIIMSNTNNNMQTQTSNTLHNAIMEAGSKDRPPMLALAEAVQIILTGIDNDIYSTVDACPNACEMWKAIERLKQGESINVQDLETNLYWEFRKYTSQDGELLESYYSRFYKMMNELIRNQCKVTNHQVNVQFLLQLQPEWQRAEKIARVANPLTLVAQQQPDKEIDILMALISLSFKKIYKPTNNSLRTSSNTIRANQDNSLRINRSAGYENQRIGNVVRARETVEQADWRDDTDDDELEDQELEAHYMYMAQLQQVSPDAADSGPIFDDEPLQKVSNDDHYNVFAMQSEHPEQSESIHDTYPIDQDAHNVIIDSLDMSYDRKEIDQNDDDNDLANERELLASLIEKL